MLPVFLIIGSRQYCNNLSTRGTTADTFVLRVRIRLEITLGTPVK